MTEYAVRRNLKQGMRQGNQVKDLDDKGLSSESMDGLGFDMEGHDGDGRSGQGFPASPPQSRRLERRLPRNPHLRMKPSPDSPGRRFQRLGPPRFHSSCRCWRRFAYEFSIRKLKKATVRSSPGISTVPKVNHYR